MKFLSEEALNEAVQRAWEAGRNAAAKVADELEGQFEPPLERQERIVRAIRTLTYRGADQAGVESEKEK